MIMKVFSSYTSIKCLIIIDFIVNIGGNLGLFLGISFSP